MSSPAAVETSALTWTPYGRRTPVLDRIDLRVESGERVLLVGPSGAGKSTLLLALAGVLDTTAHGELTGSVEVAGGAGLLVQDPRDARVAERAGRDVAFGCENAGMPRDQIAEAVTWALDSVGFPYGPDRPTSALSGGEAQRLALAGVIASRPQVLLLDEPTAMLDSVSAATVRAAVDSVVRETGATLIVVEHRLGPWLPLVDRVVVLDTAGRVAADVRAAQLTAGSALAGELAAQGVWAPGAPDPELLAVPEGLLSLGDAGATGGGRDDGEALLAASGVGLVRVPPRTFGRRDRTPREALAGVDARVRAGRVLAIRGDSGAGKSSLVALLTGLEKPTSGQVVAHDPLIRGAGASLGSDPARWRSRDLAARIAWVPQEAARTIVGRTVRESLLATCRALGLPEADSREHAGRADDGQTTQNAAQNAQTVPSPGAALDGERAPHDAAFAPGQARALALAELLGLAGALDRNPHTLSGGEKRRLALASALAHGPRFVAFDEPTVGQDRHTWAAVAGLIAAARGGGAGVVLSTHDETLVTATGLVDETLTLARLQGVDDPVRGGAPHVIRPRAEASHAPAAGAEPGSGAR